MKRQIQLQVPQTGQRYDVWVPMEVPADELCRNLADAVKELSQELYSPSGKEMLILQENRTLVNPKKTLADYDVGNGDILIML